MNLVLINQFDPLGDRLGGIGNYVLSFIKYAPDNVHFKIIGVSNTHKLLKWHEIDIFGKKVLFLPIVSVKDINVREHIPLSLRFSIKLLIIRKMINKYDVLFCQRNEYVLPLYFNKNKIFTIIHSDLSLHLNPSKSNNGWSRVPSLYLFLQKLAFERSSHTYSVNHNSIDYVCSHIDNYESKISFIHTWADPLRFQNQTHKKRKELGESFASDHGIDPEKKRLIYLGRFQKEKNLMLLLKSFLNFKNNCVLFMAGVGEQMPSVKKFIEENNLHDVVILLGNVPHENVPNILSACDLYVSSSNFEGMSIALMEALCSGLYVITTNTGEASYLLDENKNGVISTDFSVDGFTTAIKKGLENISEKNFEFSFDIDKFSPEKSIKQVLSKI